MFDFIDDKSFDIEKTKEYKLSIQVSLDGFSFLVVNPLQNILLVFKSVPLKISSKNLIGRHLKEWILSEELLQKTYKNVYIIIHSNNFTLVPNNYYQFENTGNYSALLFEQEKNEKTKVDSVSRIESKLLFSVHKSILETLESFFEDFEITHPVKLLIEKTFDLSQMNSLVLYFISNHLNLLLFQNDKLLLANAFKISNINDLVYYVLTILKQTEIESAKTSVFFGGETFVETEIEKVLAPYFESINYLEATKFNNLKLASPIVRKKICLI